MPGAEPFEIQARDGHRLGATLFRPASSNGRALQIYAAAGVKQEYYGEFAAYLSERGFTVLTFDYRGIGRSGLDKLLDALREPVLLDGGAEHAARELLDPRGDPDELRIAGLDRPLLLLECLKGIEIAQESIGRRS